MQKRGRSLPQPVDFVARPVQHGVAMKRRVDGGGWLRQGICLWLVVAPAIAAGACSTAIGDQVCTEDSNESDKDDDCPYGPLGGPKVKVSEDDSCKDLPDFTQCAAPGPSWLEVWARFTAGDGGRCSNAGCHSGKSLGAGLELLADQPGKAYEALSKYENDGHPYLRDALEPGAEKAWILCNLQALRGGYSPMPQPGGLTGDQKDKDLALVRAWVNCGMKATGGGTGPGGGGGAGGGGGLGGAGGAGGN